MTAAMSVLDFAYTVLFRRITRLKRRISSIDLIPCIFRLTVTQFAYRIYVTFPSRIFFALDGISSQVILAYVTAAVSRNVLPGVRPSLRSTDLCTPSAAG